MRAAATITLWLATLGAIFWGMMNLLFWVAYGERYHPRSFLGRPGIASLLLLWGVVFQGLLLLQLY
jgi:hypothetical protein